MLGLKSLRHALLMGVAAFGSAGAAAVATSTAYAQEATRTYNIQPQDLNSALREFAVQTGRDVLYPPAIVAGKRSPGAQGQLTESQALNALLEGTGLRFTQTASNGYAVQNAASPTQLGADDEASRGGATGEGATAEILVIGQRPTLNADIRRSEDATQPYVVFNRDDIEQSGAQDLNAFIGQRLSSSGSANSVTGQQPAANVFGSFVALRGLDPSQTLILVDGRRIPDRGQVGSAQQPDINSIPLAAIERIEVLPATASGIYGGSAVGGVINIILRRDYSGASAAVTYGNTFDSDVMRRRADLSAGYALEQGRTNLMLAYSASDGNDLLAGDRDFSADARAAILQNNPSSIFSAFVPPLGGTTNIRSLTGANLTLTPAFGGGALNAPITFVPYGYAGPASDNGAGLIASAGNYNLDLAPTAQPTGLRQNLNAAPTNQSATVTLRREFAPWLDLFADLSGSSIETSYISNAANTTFFVFAGSPGNPFNETIVVSTPAIGADTQFDAQVDTLRLALGGIFDLPFDWRGEADYTRARTNVEFRSASTLLPTASSDVSSGALNIFRDGVDFAAYTNPAPGSQSEAETNFQDFALRMSGPIGIQLPGGPITSSILLERRETVLEDSYDYRDGVPDSFYPSRSQDVDSIYGELLFPIVSPSNALSGVHLLELQLAGRFDRYVTTGANTVAVDASLNPLQPVIRAENELESTDPTIGLRFMPTQDVAFRVSFGTGFVPPQINQLVASQTFISQFVAPFFGVTDPLRGNEVVGGVNGVTAIFGGDPNLRPEQSESLSYGFVLTPRIVPGLRVSVDYVEIDKDDAITTLGYDQDSLTQLIAFAPDRVVRDPDPSTFGSFGVGPITSVNVASINAATQHIAAIDFSVDYKLFDNDDFGALTLSARGTHTLENELRLTPVSPTQDRAGVLNSTGVIAGGLDWQGSASLTWERGPWTTVWSVRYFSDYFLSASHTTDANLGSPTIPSQAYHDLLIGYRFEEGSSALSGVELQLGINNVFGEEPPLNPSGAAFGAPFSSLGDARLTNYYITIRKAF